jgi:clan AA aspartic protease (TIGR02281 family)
MRHAFLFVVLFVALGFPVYAEMYKWVDEKGTVHFTDDLSKIPEKHRSDADPRKMPGEISPPKKEEVPASTLAPQQPSEPIGFEIPIKIKGEVAVTEVILNKRENHEFIVDTGASFTNISWKMAKDLEVTIDETTPFLPVVTASDVVLNPLVTLKSVGVGKAEVENVDVTISDLPGDKGGLLGNSFLYKFRVVLDPMNGKMTLFPLQGEPSPERPGGYGKDYWISRFNFYHRILELLKKLKTKYERTDVLSDKVKLNRVNNAVKYFENQLSELDRKASFAGVPRNWRE